MNLLIWYHGKAIMDLFLPYIYQKKEKKKKKEIQTHRVSRHDGFKIANFARFPDFQ